ncbi:MAG: thiamine phosphate synthase [Acidobacteria bacterium]|nr:thiamine phosphate synthase [Acidobacteriota bacterium]
MPNAPTNPLTYLITGGETDEATTPDSEEFARLLALARAAAGAKVSLVQLREQRLRPRVLYELAARAAAILSGSATRLLVNDRADIARAAGAAGVHLTTRSLEAAVVRRAFGEDFLIGVSTHTPGEARAARDGGADFALFGPVFDTPSKRDYGPPAGLEKLREAAHALAPFPVLAVGGVARDNFARALAAGARGVAAIRLFADADSLPAVVREIGGANF